MIREPVINSAQLWFSKFSPHRPLLGLPQWSSYIDVVSSEADDVRRQKWYLELFNEQWITQHDSSSWRAN